MCTIVVVRPYSSCRSGSGLNEGQAAPGYLNYFVRQCWVLRAYKVSRKSGQLRGRRLILLLSIIIVSPSTSFSNRSHGTPIQTMRSQPKNLRIGEKKWYRKRLMRRIVAVLE